MASEKLTFHNFDQSLIWAKSSIFISAAWFWSSTAKIIQVSSANNFTLQWDIGTYNSDINKLESIHVDAMCLISGMTARSNIRNL